MGTKIQVLNCQQRPDFRSLIETPEPSRSRSQISFRRCKIILRKVFCCAICVRKIMPLQQVKSFFSVSLCRSFDMRMFRLGVYSLALMLFFQSSVLSQFSVPFQRLPGWYDSAFDLYSQYFQVRALELDPISGFSQDNYGPFTDYDPDIIQDQYIGSVNSAMTEGEFKITTPAPINTTTYLGEIDSLIYNDMLINSPLDCGSYCDANAKLSGDVDYQIQEPEEEITEGLILRANLWCEMGTNEPISYEDGFLYAAIQNVTTGDFVLLTGTYDHDTHDWNWMVQDQYLNQYTGSTAGGMSEFHYEELNVSVGDVIRISTDCNHTVNLNTVGPDTRAKTSELKCTAWFDVIGY
jgi:hypothetical protein